MRRVHSSLSELPMFASLPPRAVDVAESLTTSLSVAAGSVLCREGELGREAFVVVAGEAEVTRTGEVVAQVGAGDLVGELALLGARNRSATVTALTDMTVLVANPQEFAGLLDLPGVRAAVDDAARAHAA